jgi:hypothetical protein
MLIQKCGLTERFNLKTRQQTPMLMIASYFDFIDAGKSGTMAETNGVGTVQMTASALSVPSRVSTPMTRPCLVSTFWTGQPTRTVPPSFSIAAQSVSTSVWLPPSM